MSEIENGRLSLYGTEHSKCNHLMTLGFKGLNIHILHGRYTCIRDGHRSGSSSRHSPRKVLFPVHQTSTRLTAADGLSPEDRQCRQLDRPLNVFIQNISIVST